MSVVIWSGRTPPEAVRLVLEGRGMEIVRDDGGPARPVVVFTASGRRPPSAPATDAGWIWLSGSEVAPGTRLEAVRRGAYDVVALGDPDATATLATRITELATPLPDIPAESSLVIASDAARAVARQVGRVAQTNMSVLFTGETGTGKEVLARLTHAWSARHQKPFVPINCAAIPNELMEAELFGYARGAFSGAVAPYDGLLVAAAGGTVFLDEVDDTSPETQVKLLRVLEDHVVSRLGENVWHQVDFRVLAATNRDLRVLIDAGLFGADLYERLAIVTIRLAPLRERIADLPLLAAHFMARFAREQHRAPVTQIRADTQRLLEAYPWPGNIRELRNVLYETLVYKRAGDELLPSDLPRRLLARDAGAVSDPAVARAAITRKIAGGTMNLREEVATLERIAIEEALSRTGGNAAEAARLLGQVGRGMARDPGGTVRAMVRRLKG